MMHVRAMTTSAELERLLWHLRSFAQSGDEWSRGFAQSVLSQAKRPSWRPSSKQLRMMQKLVSELFTHPAEGELELFEEGED